MAVIQDDSKTFTINIAPPGQYLDFSGYIHEEPDPVPYLSLPNNYSIHAQNMPRGARCYFQTPMPIGLGDFILNFKINATVLQKNDTLGGVGGHIPIMFAHNQTTTTQQISREVGDGLVFSFREYTDQDNVAFYVMQIRSRTTYGNCATYSSDCSGANSDCCIEWSEGALNTIHDVTIIRTNLWVSFIIKDSNGNILFDNSSTPTYDDTDIQYFLPMCGRDDPSTTLIATGTAYNYTLNYSVLSENFLNYEHMPSGDPYLSVPESNTIQVTAMPRIAGCYLRKAMPIGAGDFTLKLTIFASQLEYNPNPVPGGSAGGCMALFFANQTGTTDNQKVIENKDGLIFTFREYTTDDLVEHFLMRIATYRSDGTFYWSEYGFALENLAYDIIISRISSIASVKIYNHLTGELLATRTAPQPDLTDIQYFIPMSGRGGGGADALIATGNSYEYIFS